jgi:hypothetical protein
VLDTRSRAKRLTKRGNTRSVRSLGSTRENPQSGVILVPTYPLPRHRAAANRSGVRADDRASDLTDTIAETRQVAGHLLLASCPVKAGAPLEACAGPFLYLLVVVVVSAVAVFFGWVVTFVVVVAGIGLTAADDLAVMVSVSGIFIEA